MSNGILAVAALSIVVATPREQPPRPDDFLATGIVFTGAVTFERKVDRTDFTVIDHDSQLLLRMTTERAFSLKPSGGIEYRWAQSLTRAQTITVRIADEGSQPAGSLIREETVDNVAQCLAPAPTKRTATDIVYLLRCISFDEQQRVVTPNRGMTIEIDMAVSVPNQSPADRFLGTPRSGLVYARLESTP
jgi:hypothetical protein